MSKQPNKTTKNILLFVVVLGVVIIVKKYWLPGGIIGLFE